MTREQAINYLISSGFTHEQVGDVVRALTYAPTTKNDLGVDEVTALAEWVEKLTKASEDAYNKGFKDGIKGSILKADYENRLKADLEAMLEEIDLEMSEQSFGIQTEPWEVVEKLRKKIIQQKINALKENTDGNKND